MYPTRNNLLVTRRMTVIAVIAICISAAASLMATAGQRPGYTQGTNQPLLLAVTPNLQGQMDQIAWEDLAAHISQRSGQRLRILLPDTLMEFEGCIAANAYDLVFAFPHQLDATSIGTEAIVQRGREPRGLVVVHFDSELYGLQDLSNVTVAIPKQGAFAATHLAHMDLTTAHATSSMLMLADADATYDAVLSGQVAAGSGTPASFNGLPEHVRSRLRVIHQTDRYAPAAIHAFAEVSGHVQQRLKHAFTGIQRASPVLHAGIGFMEFEDASVNQMRHIAEITSQPSSKSGCPST